MRDGDIFGEISTVMRKPDALRRRFLEVEGPDGYRGWARTLGLATGEDAAAGLPDEMVPPEDVDLGLFDPSPGALPTDERIARARRAEAAALETPLIRLQCYEGIDAGE